MRTPAIDTVINAANEPPIIARNPSFAKSSLRAGTKEDEPNRRWFCLSGPAATRPAGLEPATYGLESRKAENVTSLKSKGYKTPENQLTANLTENDNIIQQNLTTLKNCWPSLPPNIRAAIMMLIEGDDE